MWEHLKKNPKAEKTVGLVMSAYAADRPSLADVYPTEALVKNAKADSALLVDCCGGIGHDIVAFRRTHSEEKLTLQERPKVTSNIKDLDRSIEKMEYDFFTPQPLKSLFTCLPYLKSRSY